ncbi:MAG: SDR family oxidoreductase [Bdellovibrio sp.]|nr:SDR family oxidoreductase [Bdellovibrio sp.]
MTSAKKIALITGANRGIGLETARELAKKGIHVIIGVRSKDSGEKTVAAFKSLSASYVILDVTKTADHKNAFDYIEKEFGHLDILVNNAGVYLDNLDASNSKPNQTSTTSLEVIRRTFDANFFGVIALTQTMLPLIKKAPTGRIVNLSSILGSQTLHSDPNSMIYESKAFAYNSSKVALNAFTIHLAHELKDTNIKVNSAHPGWVKTDMGGAGAMMEVTDGAQTSFSLALLPDSGPTGGFFHRGQILPW